MTTLVKGSIASVAKHNGQSIAQTFLQCDLLVLVDTSGSMEMPDCPDGQTRYRVACNELAKLQATNPGKVGVISWSANVCFCPSGVPDLLGTTTNLAKALRFVLPADGLGIQIVIISDGEPDDTVEPLMIAKQFQSKLNTVFVGPEGGAGQKFLQLLASTSGGQCVRQDTSELNNLSLPLHRLLLAA